ncbi:ABC transporter substrate-binding protein [Paenibacillus puerhi]|uniref:ABC transporter substrate-binding protein n=1 Tax=Paenibacillus puerhi TaxID=2692622 RepID=UPI0013575AD3|nr:iron-siderophore ABC transporter substrate-binding protein [Paenibacillus puerhi]
MGISIHKWPAAGLVLSLALTLAACGSGSVSAPSGSGSAPAPAAPVTQADAGKPYTVQHAMGETTIKETPKRVVVLVNDAVEAALSLDVKPIGMVKAWGVEPMYEHLKSKLDGVQIVGDENQPNLEAIAALKPDLIIGNKLRQEKIYDQLSSIAPTVFSTRTNSDVLINYKVYAAALNKKEEGDKQLDAFDKRIQAFRAKLGDKINTKVSLVRFYVGDKVRVHYADSFGGGLIKLIGLQRPAAQDKTTFADIIGKERIPDLEADMLFYFTLADEKGETTKTEEQWLNDPLWKNLEVVKKGKVYRVNDGIWNSSGGLIAANLMLDDLEKYMLK